MEEIGVWRVLTEAEISVWGRGESSQLLLIPPVEALVPPQTVSGLCLQLFLLCNDVMSDSLYVLMLSDTVNASTQC